MKNGSRKRAPSSLVEPTHIEPYSVTAQSRLISVNKRQKATQKIKKKSNFQKKKRKMPGSTVRSSTTSLNSTSSNETVDEWEDFDASEILKLFPKQHVGHYKNNGIYTIYTPSTD